MRRFGAAMIRIAIIAGAPGRRAIVTRVRGCLLVLTIVLVALLAGQSVPIAISAPIPKSKSQLELEKLGQEVRQLKMENDRSGSLYGEILAWAPFGAVLLGIVGVVWPVVGEFRQQRKQRGEELQQRRDAEEKRHAQEEADLEQRRVAEERRQEQRAAELEQRRIEERSRFDDLFAKAVANLGSAQESVQVSAAVALQSFLRDEYAPFHEQVYSVLCANLAVRSHSRLVNRFIVRGFSDAVRRHVAALEVKALEGDPEPEPLDLARCRMPRVDLHSLDLGKNADLAFAILKDANLRGTKLIEAKGIEVSLERAQLTGADLTEARLHGAACRQARFHNARLVSTEFRESSKCRADLRSAEFYNAQLQGAHFDGADLTRAKFNQANLADAHFPRATLDLSALHTILEAAVIREVPSWRKAHFDPDTRTALEDLNKQRDARQKA